MTFDETLGALLGLIGQRVRVRITVGVLTVAFIDGFLERTLDRGPAVLPGLGSGPKDWENHDTHFFAFGGTGETGFYVSSEAFVSARWLGVEKDSLQIEQSPDVMLSVSSLSRSKEPVL